MTAKHTPAPWDARWMMHNGECSQYLVTHKNLYEECDANAKLIAAAPDLLDALIACNDAMEYMSEYDIPIYLPQQVKDAISKATQ